MNRLSRLGIPAAVLVLTAACTAIPTVRISTDPSSAVSLTAPHGTPATQASPVTAPVSLETLQQSYVAVVRSVLPAVVQIETDSGLGSGIVFDTQGDIVTNAHVVSGATTVKVTTSSGHTQTGQVVGSYVPDDIAVVKVDPSGLTVANFGDSSQMQVGYIVLAIGNPLGLQSSVTAGIVSAVARTVSEDNGATLPDTIQTSAEINPGNSGGALVNLQGEVIGIPTLAAGDPQMGGAAAGIGFAIPSNLVKDIAGQIVKNGRVVNSHRAYLGIQTATNYQGTAVVTRVVAGGPADRAGMQAGDTIVSINGQAVSGPESVASILASLNPGSDAAVVVRRSDGNHTLRVTLGQLPS
ncbi:MAG: S1C family serine protease [Candidatus Dormibacteria bacterium]